MATSLARQPGKFLLFSKKNLLMQMRRSKPNLKVSRLRTRAKKSGKRNDLPEPAGSTSVSRGRCDCCKFSLDHDLNYFFQLQ
jgi:hypothetical protein